MRTAIKLALLSCIVASGLAHAQQPDFTGSWERNARLSQDAFEKIDIAMGSGQSQRTGTGSPNAVSQETLLRNSDLATQRRLLLSYVEVLEVVEIEHARDELKVWVGQGDQFFSLFYVDGEPHQRELDDGQRVEATARWEDNVIRVTQTGEGDAVLNVVYTMMNGDQIAVIFQFQSKLTQAPILFRTVYDRVEED